MGEPATYWITNPKNYFQDNVGGGGDKFGYWITYPYQPTGPSAIPKEGFETMEPGEAFRTALYKFENNVAHSYKSTGLFIDESVNGDLRTSGRSGQIPLVDPYDVDSEISYSEIYKFTAYKNSNHGIWTSEGPFHVIQASIADCMVGITMRGFVIGKSITQSVILGETENTGEPQEVEDDEGTLYTSSRSQPKEWQHPRQGVAMYQGALFVSDSYFNYFKNSEELGYHAGAISFKAENKYPLSVMSSVSGILFGFTDGVYTGNRVYDGLPYPPESFDLNGNKVAMFHDLDGSVTSIENAYAMRNGAYTMTDGCELRENWNFIVCPQSHGKMEVNLREGERVDFLMTRDDLSGIHASIDELQMGQIPKSFITRLGGDYSYTLHWAGQVPREFDMKLKGGVVGDYVRLGVCIGTYADFELSTKSGNIVKWGNLGAEQMWVEAADLNELDNDSVGNKFYYDRSAGVLYVKFVQHFEREEGNLDDCPGECPYVKVELFGTTDDNGDCRSDEFINSVNTQAMPRFTGDLPGAPSNRPEEWGAGATKTTFSSRSDADVFSAWGQFGECSKPCGGGLKQRTRTCVAPLTENGDSNCVGSSVDVAECGTNPCPVDGGFSEWSAYSQCQQDYLDPELGFKTRERSCSNPRPAYGGEYCTGSILEVLPCTLD